MPLKKEGKRGFFTISEEDHARIVRHAKRLRIDMNDIIRDGTLMQLERLDEQERIAIEKSKANKPNGASLPDTPMFKWGKSPISPKRPPVMSPATTTTPPLPPPPVPEKLTRSFRRWAEHIEAAEDRSDGERRAEIVLQDMRERCTSDNEVAACYDMFKSFMAERANARRQPAGVVEVGEGVNISGDLED